MGPQLGPPVSGKHTLKTIRIVARRRCNTDVLKINAIFPVQVRAEPAKDLNIVLGGHGGNGEEIDVRCAAPDTILLGNYEATEATDGSLEPRVKGLQERAPWLGCRAWADASGSTGIRQLLCGQTSQ